MRAALLGFLRATHLINLADGFAAARAASLLRAQNDAYRAAHPNRTFPDPKLIFEVAGHASLAQFDQSGQAHAQRIAALLRASALPPAPRILEWGCGPARILGHLPAALGDGGARFSGCDPDPRSIRFAQHAHPAISFAQSRSTPPAPYPASAFDAIYGVSIFTHLDQKHAEAWAAELARLLTHDGGALVTTHGDAAAARLTPEERRRYEAGDYVARGGARMGSRVYISYFNETAGRRLFGPHFADIAFRPASPAELGQDIWLLRRPRRA